MSNKKYINLIYKQGIVLYLHEINFRFNWNYIQFGYDKVNIFHEYDTLNSLVLTYRPIMSQWFCN